MALPGLSIFPNRIVIPTRTGVLLQNHDLPTGEAYPLAPKIEVPQQNPDLSKDLTLPRGRGGCTNSLTLADIANVDSEQSRHLGKWLQPPPSKGGDPRLPSTYKTTKSSWKKGQTLRNETQSTKSRYYVVFDSGLLRQALIPSLLSGGEPPLHISKTRCLATSFLREGPSGPSSERHKAL